MKLSLAIIAKDEFERLNIILSKFHQHFDEICIAYDDDVIPKQLGQPVTPNHPFMGKVKLFKYEKDEWEIKKGLIDFARKRNFLASKITGDYYFRLDTDDFIVHPENIRPLAEEALRRDLDLVYCWYIYSRDADGNINADHFRETIVKAKNKNIFWNKKIHENILPKTQIGFKTHVDYENRIIIDHRPGNNHAETSLIRNLQYLLDEYNTDKEKTDPRTIAYLGRTFVALGDPEKAKFFLQKHIVTSGWDEDRYISWCYLAEIFKKEEDYTQAIACCNEAMLEIPEWPDSYLKLHDIFFQQDKWEKAIEFGKIGMSKPTPKTMTLRDPSSYTWRPALSMAFCYLQLDQVETAYKLFNKAKELAPTFPFIKENEDIFEGAYLHKEFMKHFLWLFNYTRDRNEEMAVKMLDNVPKEIMENEFMIDMVKAFHPAKEWTNNSIVIFCPKTPEAWSPKSIESGIGGSEEAVIRMAEQLAKLGYAVTVYNTCGDDEGEYNSVKYINTYKFNKNDKFNILISWRTNLCHHGIYGRYNFVWLHDCPDESFLGEDSIKKVDKIIVLSNYHRTLLPKHIPDSQVFISSNGIVPEDFKVVEGIERNPKRIIWASSYDRGLQTILEAWPKIKEEVPEAEIHIFYGWQTYDNYMKMGFFSSDFKTKMLKLFKQDGVFEHGRVGHKDLLVEYAKSGVWAYPCNYKGEINCIALTKAVACGCTVITNKFAVMIERSPMSVQDDIFIDELIGVLNGHVFYDIDLNEYIIQNSWEAIAVGWDAMIHLLPSTVIFDRSQWIRNVIPDNGMTIVDIGSNKGHIFDGYNRANITSVDIDEYDIPNFVRADARSLPFENKKFATALLAEILEHVPDDIKVMQEAKRVSDRLVITVPYEHEWPSFLKPFNKVEEEMVEKGKTKEELALEGNPTAKEFHTDDDLNHLWHCRYYTPKTLSETLQKAGFTKYEVSVLRSNEWSWIGAIVYE